MAGSHQEKKRAVVCAQRLIPIDKCQWVPAQILTKGPALRWEVLAISKQYLQGSPQTP